MAQTLEEFLISVKYNIDAPSQQTFFNAMKRAATSVAGVAGELTGLGLAVMKIADMMAQSGEKLYWMSQRLGDSVADIQGLAYAMSGLGESAEQATAGIERFGAWTRSMGPAATGYLHALGITATDTVGRMRQLGEYFRAHGGTQAQQGTLEYALTLRRAQMMGIDEQTMLAASSGKLEQNLQQAGLMQRLVWGANWQSGPQQFATQSVEVMNRFRQMGFFFQNLTQQFGLGLFNAILPELDKINALLIDMLPAIQRFLNHLISYAPAALQFLQDIMRGFKFMLEIATFAMETWDKLPGVVQHAVEAMLLFPSALKLMGSPLFWILGGITALLLLLDDYQHWQKDQETGSKEQHSYFKWDAIDNFMKPIIAAYKTMSEYVDKVMPIKGLFDMFASTTAAVGLLAISGALDGIMTRLLAMGTFLMLNPIGVGIMAALGLLDVAVFGKQGNAIIEKRAKELGYTIQGEGTPNPTFTKDGKTLDYGQMMREEGFGPSGVTFGQAHGFKPLPWQPGYKDDQPFTLPDLKRPAPGEGRHDEPTPGDDTGKGMILGMRGGGRYQTASTGWIGGPSDAGGNSDPFYNMLRFNLDAIIEKLSDLLDTLNAMALKMGVERGDLGGGGRTGGGGGGDGDLLPPGASPEEQEARLRQIEQRESGGQNINNRTGPGGSPASSASGFYQMIDSTWLHAAHLAGINTQHYPRAIDAPWDIQHKAALALINEQGERPWISSAGHHLSHQPLGSDDTSPGWAGRALTGQRHSGIIQNNNTNISVVAPSPASAGAQVAEHQIRIHEHHSRFTAGKLLA